MRRRRFLGLMGGAATWPVAARGEQTAKPARIGFYGTYRLSRVPGWTLFGRARKKLDT